VTVAEAVAIGRAADIPPGCAARVEIAGTPVAVFNLGGTFYALDDTCSHQEASLSEGDLDVDRCAIECPLHGSSFDLRTGEPLSLPAVEPVRAHHVEVDGDGVLRVALAEDEDAA
jgi:3-phenylpropionate/trans-cinnamate dioxygenase ferredoxin subunit